jgi:hypothetical protein
VSKSITKRKKQTSGSGSTRTYSFEVFIIIRSKKRRCHVCRMKADNFNSSRNERIIAVPTTTFCMSSFDDDVCAIKCGLKSFLSISMQYKANSLVLLRLSISEATLVEKFYCESKSWTVYCAFREHLGEDYETLQLLVTCQQFWVQPTVLLCDMFKH